MVLDGVVQEPKKVAHYFFTHQTAVVPHSGKLQSFLRLLRAGVPKVHKLRHSKKESPAVLSPAYAVSGGYPDRAPTVPRVGLGQCYPFEVPPKRLVHPKHVCVELGVALDRHMGQLVQVLL